jgi:AhpD family alkylhydroperoxidase
MRGLVSVHTMQPAATSMQRSNYQAHSAAGLRALGRVHTYLSGTDLSKPLLDLVYLRASQMNGCAFCIDMHSRDARKGGESAERLSLLPVWREADALFTERERAALAWTESITAIAQTRAPNADYASAAAAFTEKELSDLTLAVGLINVYNRLAIGFRRQPLSTRSASHANQVATQQQG